MTPAMNLKHRLTRRNLLRLGVGLGGSVMALAGLGAFTFRLRPAAPGMSVLSGGEIAVVDALCDALFPPGNALQLSIADLDVAKSLDLQVARFDSREQRVLRALLTVLDEWPRISFFARRRFSELPTADRVQILRGFDDSEKLELRGLAELLRIVIGMNVFESPVALAAIGHRFGCAYPGETDSSR